MSLDYAVNEQIRSKEVRLIDDQGGQVGLFLTNDAIRRAREAGMDLVAVNIKSVPPVCKILDYGKFRYEQQKREKEIAKKARASQTEVKEIQLRPVTDSHDIAIKAKRAQQFLEDGDKVKIIVKFKGREIHHKEIGHKVLQEFLAAIGEHKLEKPVAMSERQLFTIAAPVAKKA